MDRELLTSFEKVEQDDTYDMDEEHDGDGDDYGVAHVEYDVGGRREERQKVTAKLRGVQLRLVI